MPVTGLPNGTYEWRAKGPQYLANSGTLTLTGSPLTIVEMGLMLTGDADNDNLVAISDYSVLKNTFGRSNTNPGYDGRADFNGDDTVTLADFTLLKRNYGMSGAPMPNP